MYSNKIRDTIHGFIYFSDKEQCIINWPEFQRLRYIKQLALTSYVYPGAVHTRFEHSLGVMELSTRMFDRLCSKSYEFELIEKNFQEIDLSIEQAKQILRLSALFHDSGHLPFSHGAEAILPKGFKHEDISVAVIEYLKPQIDSLFFNGAAGMVSQIIKGVNILSPLNIIKNIISGSIDADRMDYLLRDSHHCGVDYGYFDYKRLIETLTVRPGLFGLDLAINIGGIHTLEALIMARYYMFTQVYYHRTRRIYDIYLKNYMESWKEKINPFTEVLKYDDVDLINDLRKSSEKSDGVYHEWAYRICARKNHSLIYETSEFADIITRRKAEGIYKKLSEKYGDLSFIKDHAEGTIHKFLVTSIEGDAGEEFYVLRNGKEFLLTDESHVIEKMPKKFNLVRIYADRKDKDKLYKLQKRFYDLIHSLFITISGTLTTESIKPRTALRISFTEL